jgi:hypothetical protein
VGRDFTTHGYVSIKGVNKTLDIPGSLWTEIYSINALGEIEGAYEDADGIHGFVGFPRRSVCAPGIRFRNCGR